MLIPTAFFVSFTAVTLGSASSPCYFPDGTYMSNDSPCFPDQAESFCCGQGHSCMSNGLCRWPDAEMPFPLAYIRGSCTDLSWESSACPQHCGNVLPYEWDVIIECPNNEFCCSPDNTEDQACCTANDSTPISTPSASLTIFELGTATTITVIGAAGYTAVGTSSYVFASATTTPQTSTTGVAASTGVSSGTTIGIGAGVGGGVALLILLGGWLFWRRKDRSRTSQRQTDRPGSEPETTARGQPSCRDMTGYGNENDKIIGEPKRYRAELAHEQIHILDGTELKGQYVSTRDRMAELDGGLRHF